MRPFSLYIIGLLVIFNSCGIVIKTRYGNELKINLELGIFSKEKKTKSPLLKSKNTKTANRCLSDSCFSLSQNTPKQLIDSNIYFSFNYNTIQKHTKLPFKKASKQKAIEQIILTKKNESQATKTINKKNDIRPLAPYLITSLALALFLPYISIFLVIKAKRFIKASDFAYKGYNLANILMAFLILYLFFIITIYTILFLFIYYH